MQEIWRRRTDEQVIEASRCLEEYEGEDQRVILAELRRRGLPESVMPSPHQQAKTSLAAHNPFSFQDFLSYMITASAYLLVVGLFFLLGFEPRPGTLFITGGIFIYLFRNAVSYYVTRPLAVALSVRDRPTVLGIVCWMTIVACLVVLGRLLVDFQLNTTIAHRAGGSVLDTPAGRAQAAQEKFWRSLEFWQHLVPFAGVRGARAVLYLICAVGLLRGRNWARLLFVGSSSLDWVYSAVSGGAISLATPIAAVGLGLWSAFVYYLTRRETSRFFQRNESAAVT